MDRSTVLSTILGALAWLAMIPPAHAQFAVIDVGAIGQLIQQIEVMREQLTAARDQMTQAQEEYASITGARNMDRLLSNVERNYLPANWADLAASVGGLLDAYGALSAEVQRAIEANSVLTPSQLARLSAQELADLESARRVAAMPQALARRALVATSERFRSLQELIDAIGRADDQKAILDLQARIGAEATMLANEQTKLQVLANAAQAEASAERQRLLERAIGDVGSLRQLPPLGL